MIRPSNRELKVLAKLGVDLVLGPDDFDDAGEKVFAGLIKKGWVESVAGGYRNTEKGKRVYDEQVLSGRWKR